MHEHELKVMAFHVRPAVRKFVLLTIASFADVSGRGARPSVSTTLAMMVGLDKRQVKRHVAALRRDGYLLETGRFSVPGGREVVEYAVALDEQTRQAWASGVIDDTHPSGVAGDTRPNYQVQNPVQELRSCTPACGGGEEEPMGYDFWDVEASGGGRAAKRPGKGQKAAQDDAPRRDGFGSDAADPEAQKGPQGLKAVSDEFRRRAQEIDPVLQHDTQRFLTIAGSRCKAQGLGVETVAAMAYLFFDDPAYMAAAKGHPYRYFFEKWAELHQRVVEAQRKTYTVDPNKRKKDLEALGL